MNPMNRMKKSRALFSRWLGAFLLGAFLWCLFLFAAGCAAVFSPPVETEYYMPEYESPAVKKAPPVPGMLQVKLFSAAPPYRSSKMIYSEGKFTRQSYHYHKWRSEPADIVTYLLTRDIRNSALFGGVFFYDEEAFASHFVSGIVEDFYELDGPNDWKAVFSISVTLSEERDFGSVQKVCYQKTYKAVKTCRKKTPRALSEAMSGAISTVSKALILDIYSHLKEEGAPAGD